MIVAFSRSSSPMRPISLESENATSGPSSAARISCARCSNSSLIGEKTEEIATERMPAAAMASAWRFSSSGSELRDHPTVELVAAVGEEGAGVHGADEVGGPVGERREGRGGGEAEPDRCGRGESPRLDERVDEVGGADHHAVDVGTREVALLAEPGEGRDDAGRDVLARGAFHGRGDRAAVHEDGVGVRAADVDADAHGVPSGWCGCRVVRGGGGGAWVRVGVVRGSCWGGPTVPSPDQVAAARSAGVAAGWGDPSAGLGATARSRVPEPEPLPLRSRCPAARSG